MSNHNNSSTGSIHTCRVRLMRDEESLVVNFQKQVTGEWLLDYVCSQLNLVEKYYFGLRYTDKHSGRHWLDLSIPVLKQVKDPVKDSICFRIRYYPAAPELLREDLTRYQLYMQLRRDAFHGRLVVRNSDVPVLSALIMQSELGDFEDHELDPGFSKDIDMLPKLASTMEDKVLKSYKELSGLSPADAETKFIDLVKSLESYGIDQQTVKDKAGQQFHIGANHLGVSLFQSFRRTKLIKWEFIMKCTVDGKTLSITTFYPEQQDENSQKQSNKYKSSDEQSASFLWTNILDQQSFFTLHSRDQAKSFRSGGLFGRSNKYKFSGHCYDEVVDDSRKILRLAPAFVRASSTSLNRSHSIRSSKRKPNSTAKRNSMGSVPHSQSLPIGFNDVDLNGTQSSASGGEGDGAASSTPDLSKDDKSTIEPANGGEINGGSHSTTDETVDTADDVTEAVSNQSEEDLAASEPVSVTVADVEAPADQPMFASTPVSNKVISGEGVGSEAAPVYQASSEPEVQDEIDEDKAPVSVAAVSAGPAIVPPEITVTAACDDSAQNSLIEDVTDEEYTLTSDSQLSDDDESVGDENFEPVDSITSAVNTTADVELNQADEVEGHSAENSSTRNSIEALANDMVEEIISYSNQRMADVCDTADVSALEDRLKLDLTELGDDLTPNSQANTERSEDSPRFGFRSLSVIAVLTPVLLAAAVFIFSQSDSHYLEALKQTDAFQQLHEHYYIPFLKLIGRYQ